MRKIPDDAFDAYVALGENRSYVRIAELYHCSKQAVNQRAVRERWQQRLQEIQRHARAEREEKAQQTLAELGLHHLKLWEVVEKRALEGLRNFPITSAMDAVKALDLATKNIRLVRGEPTERTESLESVIKREFDQLLTSAPHDGWNEPTPLEDAPLSLIAGDAPVDLGEPFGPSEDELTAQPEGDEAAAG